MKVDPIYITWLNYLGGFEYFFFNKEKEYQVDILESGQVKQNVFPSWPGSWGQFADTIDRKTYTKAKTKILVRSQHLTANQRDSLKFIKVSPVVQILSSRNDRRTVIVDSDSFKVYDEAEDLFTIQFTISHTDDLPTQRL